jgi:hypothetical protein
MVPVMYTHHTYAYRKSDHQIRLLVRIFFSGSLFFAFGFLRVWAEQEFWLSVPSVSTGVDVGSRMELTMQYVHNDMVMVYVLRLWISHLGIFA